MFGQMYSFFNQSLCKHHCRFEQGRNTLLSYSILLIVEKLKKTLDNNLVIGMLPTYLSKAIYCLRHNLLIAKLAV